MRTDVPGASFDAIVTDAFAAALRDSDQSMPAVDRVPSAESRVPWLTPAHAAGGDQAAVERLGRIGSRRDPLGALDPVPQGRDAVTYSTASVASGREAGLHWPELLAFRLSDDHPAAPFDPVAAAGHAADNALPAAFFPETPPLSMPDLWPEALPERRDAPAHGIRDDFPALNQEVHGRRLVWLDNAATTHKPRSVISAVSTFYEKDNSNVHRGAHELAARATEAYENARVTVQRFLHARSTKEIVFVRGATEAINLVAQSWGRKHVRAGDVILVTHLEHHSNIVPWYQLCEATGASLRVVPVDDAGHVRLDAYEAMLDRRVKLVALPQVSNALGTVVPVAPMTAMAHRAGARVLVDGAQAVAHVPVDVQCLGADFYVFSGHKIYGPSGIGVLYGREEVLEDMPPWQGGGSMIQDVTFERITYAGVPARFEAGTPHLSGAVGLAAALDYVERFGRPALVAHEQRLLAAMLTGLATVPGLSIVGAPAVRAAVVSFVLAGHTPQAVGQHLNRDGIAVRAGHHCAQPILRRFGHDATVRPSLGIYNDDEDVARLIQSLRRLVATTK